MYKVTVTGIDQTINSLENLSKVFDEKKFIKEFASEIEKELNETTKKSISSVDSETSKYMKNHKKTINKNEIIFSNGTTADLSGLSKNTRKNYPNGFSIAKAVEYGTGVVGASSQASGIAGSDGWIYDVNNHGSKGWVYEKNGTLHWTKGMSGKLIYHNTTKNVVKNFPSWFDKYIKSIMK